jgi:IclR family acetate operon transcriptional repressor
MTYRHFLVMLGSGQSFGAPSAAKIAASGQGENAGGASHSLWRRSGTNAVATPKNYSVMKAFAILKAFHDPEEWVTSCELSRRAYLPEASGYRLIQTLEELGALVRGPRGRYRPGLLLLSLSHNVTINDLLRDASQALMSDLAKRLHLTIHLGVLEQGMVTYVAKVSVPGAFPVHTRVGAQLEAYCSGLGKVLLASLPQQDVDNFVMDGELIALTPHTITTKAGLRAELKNVREHGYAMDDREHQANMRCIAVPVLDREGRAVAALSATDDAERMTPQRQLEVRDALYEVAAALRRKLYPVSQPLPYRRPLAAE